LYPGDLFSSGVHLKLLLYSNGVNQPSSLLAKKSPESEGRKWPVKSNKERKEKKKKKKKKTISC
jgi:hypothetical protein